MANEIGISVEIDSSRALKNLERIESLLLKLDKTLNKVISVFGKVEKSSQKVSSGIKRTAITIDKYTKSANKAKVESNSAANSIDKLGNSAQKTSSKVKKAAEEIGAFRKRLIAARNSFMRFASAATSNFFYNFIKGISSTSSTFLGFRNALVVASGSITEANSRMAYAIGLARSLKLQMTPLVKEYSKFVNAVTLSGSSVDKANTFFKNFAITARVLNLSGEELSGMFLALEQMISKGFLSMEELRRQLGQYLPGSMALAAQAAGYTADQIKDFYKEVATGSVETMPFIEKFSQLLYDKTANLLPLALKKTSAAFDGLSNAVKAIQIVVGIALQKPIVRLVDALTWLVEAIGNVVVGSGDFERIFNKAFNESDVVSSITNISDSIKTVGESAQNAKNSVEEFAQALSFSNSDDSVIKSTAGLIGSIGIDVLAGAGIIKLISIIKKFFAWVFDPITKFIGKFKTLADVINKVRGVFSGFIGILTAIGSAFASVGGAIAIFFGIVAKGVYDWYALKRAHEETINRMVNYKPPVNDITELESAVISMEGALKTATATYGIFNEQLKGSEAVYKSISNYITVVSEKISEGESLYQAQIQLLENMKNSGYGPEYIQKMAVVFATQRAEIKKLNDAYKENMSIIGKKADADFELQKRGEKLAAIWGKMSSVSSKLEHSVAALNVAKQLGISTDSKAVGIIEELINNGFNPLEKKYLKQIKNVVRLEKEESRLTKKHKEKKETLKDMSKQIDKYNEGINDSIDRVKHETEGLALSGKELELFDLEYEKSIMLKKLWILITKDEVTSMEKLNEMYITGVKNIEEYYDAKLKYINNKYAIKRMKEEADEFGKIWEDFGKGVEDVFVDVFSGTFKKFSDFTDAVKNVFMNLLRDLIRIAVRNAIIIPIQTRMVGGIPGVGSSAGGFDLSKIGSFFGGDSIATTLNRGMGFFNGGSGVGAGFVGPPSPGVTPTFGGTNLGYGLAGIGGALIGSWVGKGEYASMAGGIGGSLGYGLATGVGSGFMSSIGLGAIAGPIGMLVGALLGGALTRIFGDEESPTKFKIWGNAGAIDPTNSKFSKDDRFSYRTKGDLTEFYHKGSRSRVQMDTVFGTIGAGIQHTGKDEQISDAEAQQWLDSMVQIFGQFAKIDEMIADSYDLSEEAITRIKDAQESMGETIKEWKPPDFGKFIIDRYKIVFKEIGGLSEKLFNDMARAGMSAEEALAALNATLQLDTVIEGLKIVGQDSDLIWESMHMTQMERLNEQENKIYELASAYDGSIESANELTNALEIQRQATLQLLLSIKQFRDEANKSFESFREKVELAGLGDSEKYSYYKNQMDAYSKLIANTTDADLLQKYNKAWLDYANKAYSLQSGQGADAIGKSKQEWLDYLDAEQELLNQQLDKAEEKAKEQANEIANAVSETLMNTVVPAINDATDTVGDAGNNINDAAMTIFNAGGLMIEAADTIKYSVSGQDDVTITVDGQPAVGF